MSGNFSLSVVFFLCFRFSVMHDIPQLRLVTISPEPFHASRKCIKYTKEIGIEIEGKQCFSAFHIATPAAPSDTLSERLMRSWARHRFVAASSRRTEEKVASRKGSGRHWRKASRARLLSLSLSRLESSSYYEAEWTYRRKQRTTCLRSLTVCCSTN